FGPGTRHAHNVDAIEHFAVQRDMLRLAAVIQFFAHARADLLGDFARVDRRVEAAADRQEPFQLLQIGLTADCISGYCSLHASASPPSERARWTCPSEAAAAGWCSKFANLLSQPAPSSAIMRRLTKAQPIGGASLCSFCSSAAYSG